MSAFGREVHFFPSTYYDLEVWRDHFDLDDYDPMHDHEPKVILDLGAHVGVSAIYHHLKYPDAQIYCFEPDPDNFQALCRNVEQLPNVRAFQYAICGGDRTVQLYIHGKSVSHSLVERNDSGDMVEVEGRGLDSIVAELNIESVDLIKFNIEGMESEVFGEFRQIDKVDTFIGHLHVDLIDITKEDFAGLFADHEVRFIPTKPERYRVHIFRRDSLAGRS